MGRLATSHPAIRGLLGRVGQLARKGRTKQRRGLLDCLRGRDLRGPKGRLADQGQLAQVEPKGHRA